jgi:hypothetical protein
VTNQWDSNELELIGAADEITIAPARDDGSLHAYTTIWVVRVGGDLYVRSYRGPTGSWFRAAQRSRHGRIQALGMERDVSFEPGEGTNSDVDNAYRAKYGRSSYVDAMVTPAAVATTLRLVPR